MTRINLHTSAQESKFNGALVDLFTGAMMVLAGFLTFASFASI
jgi:hypothetical protein